MLTPTHRVAISPATVRAVVRALRKLEEAREAYYDADDARWNLKAPPPGLPPSAYEAHLSRLEALTHTKNVRRTEFMGEQDTALEAVVDSIVRPAFAALGLDLDALITATDDDLAPTLESSIRLASGGE